VSYSALKVTLTLPTFAEAKYRVGKTEKVTVALSAPLTSHVVLLLRNDGNPSDMYLSPRTLSSLKIPAGELSISFAFETYQVGDKRYRFEVQSDMSAGIEGIAADNCSGDDCQYSTPWNTLTWEVCQTCAGATQTVVGTNGESGERDSGTQALPLLKEPVGVAAYVQPGSGTTALVFADTGAHAVRRADPAMGTVETLTHVVRLDDGEVMGTMPGYSDGCVSGTTVGRAKLNSPRGVAVSADGLTVYVADTGNNVIRKILIPTGSGAVSSGRRRSLSLRRVARHAAARRALLQQQNPPSNSQGGANAGDSADQIVMATDAAAAQSSTCPNATYVATLAGNKAMSTAFNSKGRAAFADGAAASAMFNAPYDVVLSLDGLTLYVADRDNHRVRSVDTSTGAVTTLAGGETVASLYPHADGTGEDARFYLPSSIALSSDQNRIFVADYGNSVVRQLVVSTGEVTTVAGYPRRLHGCWRRGRLWHGAVFGTRGCGRERGLRGGN